MVPETGHGGEGRGLENSPPSHGPSGSLAGASPVAGDDPESSLQREGRQLDLQPSRGIKQGAIHVVCQECGGGMPSIPVEASDPNIGKTSSGVCDSCKPGVVRRHRQLMYLPLDCEGCGKQLELDGACPACHLGHDGQRCADCGRYAVHRSDCPTRQPGPVATRTRPDPLEGIMAVAILLTPWALLAAQAVTR